MSFSIDQARPVRDGEQLDIERLSAYLATHLPGADEPVSVEQFLHGHSNLTYLIKVGADEWVLRRPPFGNRVKTAHDMGREYRILSRLHTVYPLAPQPVLYCEDESILGAPFYVMERRRGVILAGRLRPIARWPPSWSGGFARRLSIAWPGCTRSTTARPGWPSSASRKDMPSAR